MAKQIFSFVRGFRFVTVVFRNEDGTVGEEKHSKEKTDKEILAFYVGETPEKQPETDQSPQKEESSTIETVAHVVTAKDAKTDTAKLKAQYIAELAKAGIDMKYERNFEKVKSAYDKMKQAEKKGGK